MLEDPNPPRSLPKCRDVHNWIQEVYGIKGIREGFFPLTFWRCCSHSCCSFQVDGPLAGSSSLRCLRFPREGSSRKGGAQALAVAWDVRCSLARVPGTSHAARIASCTSFVTHAPGGGIGVHGMFDVRPLLEKRVTLLPKKIRQVCRRLF